MENNNEEGLENVCCLITNTNIGGICGLAAGMIGGGIAYWVTKDSSYFAYGAGIASSVGLAAGIIKYGVDHRRNSEMLEENNQHAYVI